MRQNLATTMCEQFSLYDIQPHQDKSTGRGLDKLALFVQTLQESFLPPKPFKNALSLRLGYL
jgi:hypothetical protein